jgi:uncharacterized membrane protein YphA (DoxX/SURF4 family)
MSLEMYIKIGRLAYAIGMTGIALQHFFFPGFRPVLIPAWTEWLPDPLPFIYLTSIVLILCSAFIVFPFEGKKTSLLLGIFLMLLLILFHLPFRMANHPESLGSWTDDLKILALAGGAFVVANSFSFYEGEDATPFGIFRWIEKIALCGCVFFGVMMVAFGIDHFLYAQFVVTLVPSWIPFPLFWTYFAAVALIGSGISFITGIKIKPVGILTAIMLFTWFLILHIPRAIAMPEVANGNEITSVFQALAFSGVALVAAVTSSRT